MNHLDHAYLLRLIGHLAMDVQDAQTLNEHIYLRIPPSQRVNMIALVSDHFGYASSGYDSRVVFLDHLHSVMGYRHQELIEDLRRLAQEQDPRDNPQGYAHSRLRGRSLHGGPSLTDQEQSGHPAGDPRLLINNADLLALADEVSRA